MKKIVSIFLLVSFIAVVAGFLPSLSAQENPPSYLRVPYTRYKQQATAPSATATGYNLVYGKSTGLYYKIDAGAERKLIDDTSSATFGASVTFSAGQQSSVQAVTATVDGLTTGIIPDGATNVTVTSSVNTKLVTLPTPTPGYVVRIFCSANGYNLVSTSPTTVAINGGSGSGVKLAVAAGDLLIAYCTSATTWQIIKIGSTGTPASAGAAA